MIQFNSAEEMSNAIENASLAVNKAIKQNQNNFCVKLPNAKQFEIDLSNDEQSNAFTTGVLVGLNMLNDFK